MTKLKVRLYVCVATYAFVLSAGVSAAPLSNDEPIWQPSKDGECRSLELSATELEELEPLKLTLVELD